MWSIWTDDFSVPSHLQDYEGAAELLEPLLQSARADATADASLLSSIARMHLHCGLIDSAAQLYEASEEAIKRELASLGGDDGASSVHFDAPLPIESTQQSKGRTRADQLRTLRATDRALLSFARGDYKAAEDALRHLLPGSSWRDLDGNARADLGVQLSNLAVVLFYQGQLEEPIDVLEALLKDAPSVATTTDGLIFNLATFRELGKDE